MSPVFIWPDLVPGPSHCFYKNHLTNLSKLPHPITQTWEFWFPIPPLILQVFGLLPGVLLDIEIFICRDQPEREENSVAISIWLNQVTTLTDGEQPHFIESSILNFKFTWPNPHHIPHEEYQENLRATSVSEGSDTFANTERSPGPSSLAPHFNSLSPHPPHFQSVEEDQQNTEIDQMISDTLWLVNKRITRGRSIAEELLKTLNRVRQSQGTDLDQFTFREGGLTYRQLQQIDRINNLNLYSEATEATVAGPSSQFWETISTKRERFRRSI